MYVDIRKFLEYTDLGGVYVNGRTQLHSFSPVENKFKTGNSVVFCHENNKKDTNIYFGIISYLEGGNFVLTNVVSADTFLGYPDIPHKRARILISNIRKDLKEKYDAYLDATH